MKSIVSKNLKVLSTVLKFAQTRLSPPTFGQVAGEAALSTPNEYFVEVIKEYEQRRNQIWGYSECSSTFGFFKFEGFPESTSTRNE